MPYYKTDWTEGFKNKSEFMKVISAIFFVYTACLLPSIAFGNTNAENTENWLNVERTLYAQMIGGLIFSIFSVQPLMLVLTTAPISLYIHIIGQIADLYGLNFQEMYVAVGLWNAGFLILYAILNLSKILKWSTRSCEEIFAAFTAWAFINDAQKHISKTWEKYYINETYNGTDYLENFQGQNQAIAILWVALCFTTLWLGLSLNKLTQSPYLTSGAREFCADYALPVSVLTMTIVYKAFISDVQFTEFSTENKFTWKMYTVGNLNFIPKVRTNTMSTFQSTIFSFYTRNDASSL